MKKEKKGVELDIDSKHSYTDENLESPKIFEFSELNANTTNFLINSRYLTFPNYNILALFGFCNVTRCMQIFFLYLLLFYAVLYVRDANYEAYTIKFHKQ